jgi:hypothetical protein
MWKNPVCSQRASNDRLIRPDGRDNGKFPDFSGSIAKDAFTNGSSGDKSAARYYNAATLIPRSSPAVNIRRAIKIVGRWLALGTNLFVHAAAEGEITFRQPCIVLCDGA